MTHSGPHLSRRLFCRWLTGTTMAAALSSLPGCGGVPPRPFTTGRTVTPPKGCSDLLERNPEGDC